MQKYSVGVVVVTFAGEEQALNYQRETDFPWPLAVDSDREIYEYFGFGRAGFWDIWGPATWWAYFKEMCSGNMPRMTDGDIYQQGGDVLIDPQGIVRFHRLARGPGDRPAVDEILEVVRRNNASVSRQ